MDAPLATYRLQASASLGFRGMRQVARYVKRLGISHLYLSPIWQAREGSTHGYDVTDPTKLNPALGSRADLEALSREIGLVVDVVPNHMAASHENAWWWDVLENGPGSRYARLFDIDWERGGGKVVLPVLGAPPDEAIGDLRAEDGELHYFDRRFPLRGGGETVTADVLERQHYRLAYWRTGEREINYRRFFDIADLVATRMDDDDLFDETHRLVVELAREGIVSGVRIDHVDGLRDPGDYLERLRARLPEPTWIVVEKILARGEELPDWPVAGTTGYEFIDVCEGLFVDPDGAARLRAGRQSFEEIARSAKREVLEALFTAEVDAVSALRGVAREQVIDETVALDVYRTYGGDGSMQRWQQLTAPAMAKGVEDTALYRDVTLISRNEVGCEPSEPAVDIPAFHAFNARRVERWPATMNASSTHDTKRSEDVRARLHVLSEIPTAFEERLAWWREMNAHAKTAAAPDADDERYLYQTIVGTWDPSAEDPGYADRIAAHMQKAVRESKRRSDWRDPDEMYETALDRFVRTILDREEFRADVGAFSARIALHGAVNSLAQVVLKIASPGVPDLYQGAERWLLTLVDPDNRRPVDFDDASRALDAVERDGSTPDPHGLLDPKTKLATTRRCLCTRAENDEVFRYGSYRPLEAQGTYARNVVAFARDHGGRTVVACVPRLSTQVATDVPPVGETWSDTALAVGFDGRWRDAITGNEVGTGARLALADVLRTFPVALLTNA